MPPRAGLAAASIGSLRLGICERFTRNADCIEAVALCPIHRDHSDVEHAAVAWLTASAARAETHKDAHGSRRLLPPDRPPARTAHYHRTGRHPAVGYCDRGPALLPG